MTTDRLRHEFVELMPQVIEEGVLYISIPYTTVVHRCCCGCGEKVVTPITPTDWSVTYDGATITLSPSIGSWALTCQSHYWIRHGRVEWASQWTPDQIAAGRQADHLAKVRSFDRPPSAAVADKDALSLIARVWVWLARRRHP